MPSPLTAYLPLAIGMAVALAIGLAMLLLNRLVGPRRPTPTKGQPFECGNPPVGDPRAPVNVTFYLMALVFLVFDVEVVFLLPWAVCYRDMLTDPALAAVAFGAILGFVLLLALGLLYVLKRQVLDVGGRS
jgi:NADH-quinone oxidoreductase subunit A